MLVCRWLRRDTQVSAEHAAAQLAAVTQAAATGLPPWQALQQLGFEGDAQSYGQLANSDVLSVLTRRQGIPITLAVLLIKLARLRGHQAFGLNHPGHFLVRVDDELIDPFALAPLSPTSADARAARGADRADAVAIALRMFNNVKGLVQNAGDWHEVLAVLELQRALVPRAHLQQSLLLVETATAWGQLGAPDMAVERCTEALSLLDARRGPSWAQAPDGWMARFRSEIGERRAEFGQRAPTVRH